MARVLILGGGFGGVATAHRLRPQLSEDDEVILVDRQPYFMVGFHKTWVLVGESTLEAGRRELKSLTRNGIQVVQGNVDAIDPENRAAVVDGERIQADALVVALGTELANDQIEGLEQHAYNVYDPNELPRAAKALREFAGGKVLVGVFGLPYKCPPAPYEMAIMVREYMEARGIPGDVSVFTPLPMSIPLLGETGCASVDDQLAENRVAFLPNHQAVAVHPDRVAFADTELPYDLLFGIPAHRCPSVVVDSGLAGEGKWVKVDPLTLETAFPMVYAIGDNTVIPMANGKPLPKAGVFAQAAGEVVADRLAAIFSGDQPSATFTGEGGCYLEVGNGRGMMVRGHFLARPAPDVELTEASPKFVEEKRAFEEQRLKTWFG